MRLMGGGSRTCPMGAEWEFHEGVGGVLHDSQLRLILLRANLQHIHEAIQQLHLGLECAAANGAGAIQQKLTGREEIGIIVGIRVWIPARPGDDSRVDKL